MNKEELICVVVGGTRGIGYEIAKQFFTQGHSVIIGGRNKKNAIKNARQIDPTGKFLVGESLDVTVESSCQKFIKRVSKKFKRVDVLIITAGVFGPFGQFDQVRLNRHLETVTINLIGVMRLCHLVIPIMKKNKFGKIILFSGGGIGGNIPLANASSYYTSKGAIAFFAEVLSEELKLSNITVNAILPGQILTDLTKETFKISSKILGPVLTRARDNLRKTGGNSVIPVINLVKFLISKDGSHISGRLLSAKWDSIIELKRELPPQKYKLRRLDGKNYRQVKN